jgi:hypothetical protein
MTVPEIPRAEKGARYEKEMVIGYRKNGNKGACHERKWSLVIGKTVTKGFAMKENGLWLVSVRKPLFFRIRWI